MYTERYVTSAAAGGGDGSIGSPWTFGEALANITAGERVNIQSDGVYNISGGTVVNAGTVDAMVCFRGYETTIGDLENQGRNADTTLDITGFPEIITTDTLNQSPWCVFQNLRITGAVANPLIGNSSNDQRVIAECSILNSGDSINARAVHGDNNLAIINCDLECSGATHRNVVEADAGLNLFFSRIKASDDTYSMVTYPSGTIVGNFFFGGGVGLEVEAITTDTPILNNTFYGLTTAIQTPNLAQNNLLMLINNHATDCGTYLNNLYSATAEHNAIEMNNRTRDNTTARVGFSLESINSGEVTTDAGGPFADYIDPNNGNLRLRAGSPGLEAGLGG